MQLSNLIKRGFYIPTKETAFDWTIYKIDSNLPFSTWFPQYILRRGDEWKYFLPKGILRVSGKLELHPTPEAIYLSVMSEVDTDLQGNEEETKAYLIKLLTNGVMHEIFYSSIPIEIDPQFGENRRFLASRVGFPIQRTQFYVEKGFCIKVS